jgi:hypothetical protein
MNVDKASGAIAILHCVFFIKKNESYGEKRERRNIRKHDKKNFLCNHFPICFLIVTNLLFMPYSLFNNA